MCFSALVSKDLTKIGCGEVTMKFTILSLLIFDHPSDMMARELDSSINLFVNFRILASSSFKSAFDKRYLDGRVYDGRRVLKNAIQNGFSNIQSAEPES